MKSQLFSCETNEIAILYSRYHEITAMPEEPKPTSQTHIQFDLADVLSPEELTQFEASAKEAKAENLTEFFLDITLRVPSHGHAA